MVTLPTQPLTTPVSDCTSNGNGLQSVDPAVVLAYSQLSVLCETTLNQSVTEYFTECWALQDAL